jgi:hypothetical protein
MSSRCSFIIFQYACARVSFFASEIGGFFACDKSSCCSFIFCKRAAAAGVGFFASETRKKLLLHHWRRVRMINEILTGVFFNSLRTFALWKVNAVHHHCRWSLCFLFLTRECRRSPFCKNAQRKFALLTGPSVYMRAAIRRRGADGRVDGRRRG